MTLKYVHHVLDIRLNLILARHLDNEGYNANFQNNTWKLYKESLTVAQAHKQNVYGWGVEPRIAPPPSQGGYA